MTRIASLVVVVRSLERAIAIYEQGLGFLRLDEPTDVPSLGARHVVLRGENCLVEFLEPYDEEKPPGRFLQARGEGMFALELRIDDPDRAREQLALAFVDVRGAADDPRRFVIRPADAHGMLVQVEAAEPA